MGFTAVVEKREISRSFKETKSKNIF